MSNTADYPPTPPPEPTAEKPKPQAENFFVRFAGGDEKKLRAEWEAAREKLKQYF